MARKKVPQSARLSAGGGTVHWREENFVIFFLLISLLFCIDIKHLGVWGLV